MVLDFFPASRGVRVIGALYISQDLVTFLPQRTGTRRTLRAGGMSRQMSTMAIAWRSGSCSLGSYTIIFRMSNSCKPELACSERSSAVSSSYLPNYVLSVLGSPMMRRPV